MKTILLATLLSVSVNAFAKTEVVLFGGYRASRAQMDCWEKGARLNTAKNRGFNYRGIAWPSGAPSAPTGAIVSAASNTVAKLIKEINEHSDTRYIIAGHSSGAALSNYVASKVANPKQVELIDLDGFRADEGLQRRVKTTCWSAIRVNDAGKPIASSRNHGSMVACKDHKAFVNHTCSPSASMCLHFTLVNTKAPSDLGSDFAANGYTSCSTNLDWVTAEPATH